MCEGLHGWLFVDLLLFAQKQDHRATRPAGGGRWQIQSIPRWLPTKPDNQVRVKTFV